MRRTGSIREQANVNVRGIGHRGTAVAISDQAEFARGWIRRGQEQERLGHLAEAAASFERATELMQSDPVLWTNLGRLRYLLGHLPQALAAADRVALLAPQSAVSWNNRGMVLAALGLPEDALESFDRALQCDPRAADIWFARAKVLGSLRRHEEALDSLDHGLALDPTIGTAWSDRAAPLRALGRFAEALETCERGLALDARSASGWAQRGCSLIKLGDLDAAEASLDRALELAPADAAARVNRGLLRMSRGRFADGLEDYEARADLLALRRATPSQAPFWMPGEALAGRTLLLHHEQGLGDTIQFCRYAALLAERGERVQLRVPRTLLPLLRSLQPQVGLVDDGDPPPAVDLQCSLLSLPRVMGTSLDTIPSRVPYLRAPEPALRDWRERLPLAASPGAGEHRLRIGLAVSGNPAHVNDRQRSIALSRFESLVSGAAGRSVDWHLVQDALCAEDTPWLERLGIADHRRELVDLGRTAALIQCMDAVVSVDTAVAHVAGALAVPLYLLLPFSADWRWMIAGRHSPWYPGATLFRQTEAGQWGSVILAVEESLQALLQARRLGTAPQGERA
jgi:tetratricopeptide (TPR) repeat protein